MARTPQHRERRFAKLAGLLLAAAMPLLAQAQSEPRPSFDVAAIKPGDPGSTGGGIHVRSGGLFISINTSLRDLVRYAYNVQTDQMSGGPNWIDSARFSIEAKPDSAIPFPTGPAGNVWNHLMVQSLLADRFNLSVHWETKEGPIYELMVAKGGPKLQETDPAKQGQDSKGSNGKLTASGVTIALLAQLLTPELGRPVHDKTGLTGRYDLTLTYTPDSRGGTLAPTLSEPPASVDPNDASIFTALQEQLGLKLESAKGPIQMLVIDRADKPKQNR